MGVVRGIDYLERNLRRFMRPTRRHVALDMRFGSNRIEYQPLGVVGVISPWNYPVGEDRRRWIGTTFRCCNRSAKRSAHTKHS
jgi:hypothetical protein